MSQDQPSRRLANVLIALLMMPTAALFAAAPAQAAPGSGWGTPFNLENLPDDVWMIDAAYDGRGDALVGWQSYNYTTSVSSANVRLLLGDSGWQPTMTFTGDSWNWMDAPTVAFDHAGNAALAFTRFNYTISGTNVYYHVMRYTAGWGWSAMSTYNAAPLTNPWYLDGAIDGDGALYLAVSEYNISTGYLQTYGARQDVSGNFAVSSRLNQGGGNSYDYPQVAAGTQPGAFIVSLDLFSGYFRMSANRYVPGSGWTAEQILDDQPSSSSYAPRVGVDDSGNAMAVWTHPSLSGSSLRYSRYTPSAGWSASAVVASGVTGSSLNVEVMPGGQAVAAYVASTGVPFFTRFTAASGWLTPVSLGDSSASSGSRIAVAADAAGSGVSFYGRFVSSNSVARAAYFGGLTAGTRAFVTEDASTFSTWMQFVGALGLGRFLAVWGEYDGARTNVRANLLAFSDTVAPWLRLDAPINGAVTGDGLIRVAGTTEPGATVTANGLLVTVAPSGTFSTSIPAVEGRNPVTVTLTDAAGNSRSMTVNVTSMDRAKQLAAEVANTGTTGWQRPLRIENLSWGPFSNYVFADSDLQGRTFAVFIDDDGPGSSAYVSRYVPGVGWDVPLHLDPYEANVYSWWDVGVDADGSAVVSWDNVLSNGTRDVWALYFNATTGYGSPFRLGTYVSIAGGPRVSAMGNGRFGVGWYGYVPANGTIGMFSGFYSPATGWFTTGEIPGSRTGGYAVLMGALDGSAKVVFYSYLTGTGVLLYANYTWGVGWTAAVPLSPQGTTNVWFESAMDPGGNMTVAWVDNSGTRPLWGVRITPAGNQGTQLLRGTTSQGADIWVRASPLGDAAVVYVNGSNLKAQAVFYRTGAGWTLGENITDGPSVARVTFDFSPTGRGLSAFAYSNGVIGTRFWSPTTGFGPIINTSGVGVVNAFVWPTLDATGNATVVWVGSNPGGYTDVMASHYVVPDTTPPALTLTSPSGSMTTTFPAVWVEGLTEVNATVRVNGVAAAVLASGSFGLWYPLVNGSNLLTVTATDRAGNEATATVTVTFDDPDRRRIEGLETQNASLWTALATQNASLVAALAAQNASLLSTIASLNASLLATMAAGDANLAALIAATNASLLGQLAAVNSDLTQDIADLNASLLADLASQNSALLAEIAQTNASLYASLAAQNSNLLGALAAQNASLLAQLAAQDAALSNLIATTNSSLLAQLAAQNQSLRDALAQQDSDLLASLAAQNSSLLSQIALTNSSLLAKLAATNATLWSELTASNGALWSALNASAASQQQALAGTNSSLQSTQQGLTSTNQSLAGTQNDLTATQQNLAGTNTMAMLGTLIGVVGVVLALLSVMMARRRPPTGPSAPPAAPLDPPRPGGAEEVAAEVVPASVGPSHGHSMASESELGGSGETDQ